MRTARAWAALFLAGLLGGSVRAQPQDRVADVLARHVDALGGEAAVRGLGDFEFVGIWSTPSGFARVRAVVRREPFGYREEVDLLGGSAKASVTVTDGRYVWNLSGDGSAFVPGTFAVPFLERAFFLGLRYLEIERLGVQAWVQEPTVMPDVPAREGGFAAGRKVDVMNVRTPAGSLWQLWFDARDGRLHEASDLYAPAGKSMKFGEFKAFGDLVVPSVVLSDTEANRTRSELRITGFRGGLRHDPELFGGRPDVGIRGVVDGGRIEIVPSCIPGGIRLLAGVSVNDGGPARAQIDTGAARVALDAGFAAYQGIPLYSKDRVATTAEPVFVDVGWVERLKVGESEFHQLVVNATRLPSSGDLPEDARIAMILGGAEFFAASPLIDMDGRRMWLRGRPVTPLSAIPGGESAGPVLTVPCRRRDPHPGAFNLEVEVGEASVSLFLDTGIPAWFRLTRRGLMRLGLPLDEDHWRARGAVDFPLAGAGGASVKDLLVRLDEVRLGKIRFERPYVLLSFVAGDTAPGYEGLAGAALLLPFRRVGLDAEHRILELEPRADLARSEDGTITIPPPGPFLGFFLGPPDAGAKEPPGSLCDIEVVIPDTPAAQKGLRVGDRIARIDGASCDGQPPMRLWPSLWIDEGRRVRLTIVRQGEDDPIEVELP